MKIATWNVNGLRAATRNGGLKSLIELGVDIICVQETKLSDASFFDNPIFFGFEIHYSISIHKGRSGVAILSKIPISQCTGVSGFERCDSDGRYLLAQLSNGYKLICLYVPHGKRDGSDMSYKLELIRYMTEKLNAIKDDFVIVATDFNIAHMDIDLARPKQNAKNTMYTQCERRCIGKLLQNYIDVFRELHSQSVEYTWWPYSFGARDRNLGWRIDYFFCSTNLLDKIKEISIRKDIVGSDHCPIVLDIL